jgi:3-hydroxy-9,10-secoandrosta-1,3,5(10)-triene-9,17-dione monooxygenase reductase component
VSLATEPAPARLRIALGHFATGVTVVTAVGADGASHGSTANALASVSLEPPLLLVCLRDASLTLAALLETGRFAVNVLHERQRDVAQRFARRAAPWNGVEQRPGRSGAPLIGGALATLECALHDVADGGDHRIVVGRVLAVEHPDAHARPLLFYRGAYTELGS